MSKKMKHPVEVEGYESSLRELAENIHGMRYDKVGEFYGYCVEELNRQSKGDYGRGRHQLGELLKEAVDTAKLQQEQFAHIWRLCEPHLGDE